MAQPPNGHDEFGIKGTQHPAGRSNSSAAHHPTQPHSRFCPMLSHYSAFHPSLPTFLSLCPFCSPTPPFSCHLPPIFASLLSSTLLSVLSPSISEQFYTLCILTFSFCLSSFHLSSPQATATQQIIFPFCVLYRLSPPPVTDFSLLYSNHDTPTMNNEIDTDDRDCGSIFSL